MKKKRAVLVTTSHRGVFFGYLEREDEDKKIVEISNVRNCIYWSSDVNGFLGMAEKGPTSACRIGPVAPRVKLHDVTSVSNVTDKAEKKWIES